MLAPLLVIGRLVLLAALVLATLKLARLLLCLPATETQTKAPAAGKRWYLEVLASPDASLQSRRVPVAASLEIGRALEVDLSVNDARLSRRHLRLWLQSGRLFALDLDSTNGTFVNGEPLTGTLELAPGDLIQAGDTRFEVIAE